ncbi:MAG: 30S ribosomal protein S20 [Patescibacteria group bacterium]|nr:30S ribosomal protein S20 [Patescibacteria group bacterium]MCL5113588.1 30S ribosomal protein S20 [Patescibacteria group bacterium]
MPVTKSAQKKLRKDKKRKESNRELKDLLRTSIKKAIKNPSEKFITEVVKLADKAAKKNIIHKNKAARIKSKIAKLISKKTVKTKKTSSAKKSS